jgi:hypothetical protein
MPQGRLNVHWDVCVLLDMDRMFCYYSSTALPAPEEGRSFHMDSGS